MCWGYDVVGSDCHVTGGDDLNRQGHFPRQVLPQRPAPQCESAPSNPDTTSCSYSCFLPSIFVCFIRWQQGLQANPTNMTWLECFS